MLQKTTAPTIKTMTTAALITQRTTPERCPLNQLTLLAVACANLSPLRA
jgi:hypothetical protein